MLKIAVANENGKVAGHFGHCQSFMVFDTEDKKILKLEDIPNPGHKPGFLPNFLNDLGVNVIVSGGMGGAAVEIFNSHNIEVILGYMGDAEEAASLYLENKLESTGSVCHHQHDGTCEH